jgi:penicillin-binding protein 1A
MGVSALDLAHAYATDANNGVKVWNNVLGDYQQGPVGIVSITGCGPCRQKNIYNSNTLSTRQVISTTSAATIHQLLLGPIDESYGTGTAARIPGVDVFGKTGTTSNYVDAWFVGSTPTMTVAVWVGYPNSGKSMATDYYGRPVEGGTYPAAIWHNFMVQALSIQAQEAEGKKTTVAPETSTGVVTTSSALTGTTGTGTSTAATTQTTQTTATTPVTAGGQTQTPTTPDTGSAGNTPSTEQPVTPTTSAPPVTSSGGTGTNGGSGL